MTNLPLLHRLSLNDWERIAFYVIASEATFLGPPSPLCTISLVSRHVHEYVSPTNNSRLYARIFRFKFDSRASSRRLSERWLTSRCLAKELISRFNALRRIRGKRHFRREDLCTAYLMMSESDGRNERQLLEWAGLKDYLNIQLIHIHTTSMRNLDILSTSLLLWLVWMTTSRDEVNRQVPSSIHLMLRILLPFVSSGNWFPSVYGPDSFFNLPLCETVTSTPTHLSGPSPPYIEIIHYSHKLVLAVPLITSAASLLTTLYTEALQTTESFPAAAYSLPENRAIAIAQNVVGPTLEDLLQFHFHERIHASNSCSSVIDATYVEDLLECKTEGDSSRVQGSLKYEEDWSRLVNCYDPWAIPSTLRGTVYKIGSLSGLWKGRLMLPDFDLHFDAVRNPLQSASVHQKPLYWTLQEHHCLVPNIPLRTPVRECGDEDFLNAWLPEALTVTNLEDAVEVFDSETGLMTRYETFRSSEAPYSRVVCEELQDIWVSDNDSDMDMDNDGRVSSTGSASYIDDDDEYEDTLSQKSSGVCDILITGRTSEQHGEAWGHFTIIGKVRPWDGLISLLRSPRDPAQRHLGRWLFKGYLHGQNLVGRWRETFTPIDFTGFEGAFIASKAP